MAKITIVIKDKKNEENNPKLELELIYEFNLCYGSSYLIPPKTLAEKAGFNIFHKAVDICREMTQGEQK